MSTKETDGNLLYSRNEAAQLLRLSERSVDDMIKSGRLESVKFGRRIFVPADKLRELASKGHNGRLRRKQ